MDKTLRIAVILSAVDNMTRVVGQAVSGAEERMRHIGQISAAVAAGGAQIAAGAQLARSMQPAVDAAAAFELKMADIRKVVQGLNDPAALAEFSRQIAALGTEIGLPIDQLMDLAAAGGRMDVPKEQLIEYVREVSKMSVAFDMAAGEVGETMGKLAKMFNVPISQIGRMGDVINYLDDNAIAKGSEIMEVMLRSAGFATQVGLANQNLAALASTFLSLGTRPEVAGTAINALIRELSVAEMQGNRFKVGLQELGLTATEVQRGMLTDAQGTIMKVLEAIKNSADPISLATRLFGDEYGDDVSKLASAIQEYRKQLDLANSGAAVGSMTREFEIRNQTYTAEVQKLSNAWNEVKVNLGMAILPALKEILNVIRPIVSAVGQWFANNPEMGKFISLTVTLIGAFMMLNGVITVITGLRAAMALWRTATLTTTAAQWGLNAAMWANPLTWIVAAIIAAIAAVAILVVKWKEITKWWKESSTAIKLLLAPLMIAFGAIIMLAGAIRKVIDNWDDIQAFFGMLLSEVQALPSKLFEAGQNIVNSIRDGIASKWDDFKGWFRDKIQGIRDFLPFSPAKVGPLRDIHKLRFVETIAASIRPAPLVRAVSGVAAAAAVALTSPAGVSVPGRAAVGGGAGVSVNINVNVQPGANGNAADIRAAIMAQIPEIERQLTRSMERRQARSFG